MSIEIEIDKKPRFLVISDEEDVKLLSAFLTTFPRSTIKSGVLLAPERFVGLANKDINLKEHGGADALIDPDLIYEIIEVLTRAKISMVKFVQKKEMPLQIIPEGSNLQILIATLTKPEIKKI